MLQLVEYSKNIDPEEYKKMKSEVEQTKASSSYLHLHTIIRQISIDEILRPFYLSSCLYVHTF